MPLLGPLGCSLPRWWLDRAIEGRNGVGKHPAQRPIASDDRVVDVSTRRPRWSLFAGANGRKTTMSTRPIALVALHTPDLPEVREDDRSGRAITGQPTKELVDLRTQCVNRLHRDLVGLIPGGAPQALTATKAKQLLAGVRPRDEMADCAAVLPQTSPSRGPGHQVRCRRVGDPGHGQAHPDRAARHLRDRAAITATPIGEVVDVARFRCRHPFASYIGTAPNDKRRAGWPVHCVNLKVNRRSPRHPHGGDHPDPQPRQSRPFLLRPSPPRPRPTRKRCAA